MGDKRENFCDLPGAVHHISVAVKQMGIQVDGCDFTHTQVGSFAFLDQVCLSFPGNSCTVTVG